MYTANEQSTFANHVNQFYTTEQFPPQSTPYSRGRHIEHCWVLYQKTLTNSLLDSVFIGRLDDLGEHLRAQYGISTYSHTSPQAGPILNVVQWSIILNDVWILAAVNACLKFHLVSDFSLKNIYGDPERLYTVTGREYLIITSLNYHPANIASAVASTVYSCDGYAQAARDATLAHINFVTTERRFPRLLTTAKLLDKNYPL